MTVYLSIFALVLVASLFSLIDEFPEKVIGALVVSYIVVVVGLRYASVDYFQYEYIYDKVSDPSKLNFFIYRISGSTPVESGFAFLILVIKALSGSFAVFIFAFALLALVTKFFAFKRLSPFLILTLLLYLSDEYFWKDMSQIRNAMASGIVLLSIVFAYERRPLKYMLTLACAVLVHSAAIVAAPLYFLRHLSNRKALGALLAFGIAVAALGGVGLLIPALASQAGIVGATSRLIRYAQSEYVTGIRAFGGTFAIHVALSAFLICFYRPLVEKWPYNYLLIPMYIYGTTIMFSCLDYGIIAGRVREMICIPAAAVLLPSFVLLFKGNARLLPFSLIVAYSVLWFYLMIQGREAYRSILFTT